MLQPGTIDLSLWFNYISLSQCLVAPCHVCTVFQPLMGIIYGSWNRWLRASCHLTSHDSSSNSYWKRIPPGVYHNLKHIKSCVHTMTILMAWIYTKSVPLHDCVLMFVEYLSLRSWGSYHRVGRISDGKSWRSTRATFRPVRILSQTCRTTKVSLHLEVARGVPVVLHTSFQNSQMFCTSAHVRCAKGEKLFLPFLTHFVSTNELTDELNRVC